MNSAFGLKVSGTALTLAMGFATGASAAEFGTVVSKAPAYVQIAVPQSQCIDQPQGPPCQSFNRYENRLVGYDVVYSYKGQNYSTRVANDPGEPGALLALNVSVSPADAVPAPALAPPVAVYGPPPRVIYSAPTVVYSAPPVYYGPPVYFGPSIGLSIRGGWGGYRHWH